MFVIGIISVSILLAISEINLFAKSASAQLANCEFTKSGFAAACFGGPAGSHHPFSGVGVIVGSKAFTKPLCASTPHTGAVCVP